MAWITSQPMAGLSGVRRKKEHEVPGTGFTFYSAGYDPNGNWRVRGWLTGYGRFTTQTNGIAPRSNSITRHAKTPLQFSRLERSEQLEVAREMEELFAGRRKRRR